MKTIITAAALAVGGLLTTGVGVAHADRDVLVPYTTQAACAADGPHVVIEHEHDWKYTKWSCSQHPDGNWYITLHN